MSIVASSHILNLRTLPLQARPDAAMRPTRCLSENWYHAGLECQRRSVLFEMEVPRRYEAAASRATATPSMRERLTRRNIRIPNGSKGWIVPSFESNDDFERFFEIPQCRFARS